VKTSERRLLFGALAVIDGYVLFRDADATPYDDAYFFKRFARHFLEHGTFSWNVSEGPVHGLTSQLYQIVATGLTALAPNHTVIAGKIFLALGLLAGAWTFARLALRTTARADLVVPLTLLVFGCPLLLFTMHTGMETALVPLVLVLCFGAVLDSPTRDRTAYTAAGLTVVAYLCRPDIAAMPLLTFLVAHSSHRRHVLLYVGSFAALLGTLLLSFRLYYGTALPLPFYVKTFGLAPYDQAFRALAVRDKLVHLATFSAFAAPLLSFARPRRDARIIGLLLASAAFVGYHALATEEIMGYRARFYAPALVPLGLAAVLGAPRSLGAPRARFTVGLFVWALSVLTLYHFGFVSSAASTWLERIPGSAYLAYGALVGWLAYSGGGESSQRALLGPLALAVLGTFAALPPRRSAILDDTSFLRKSSYEVTTTRGLFDLERCLPKLRTLYHSEIGIPGLVFEDAKIVDLAGLMSRRIAFEHPRFDDYCLRERPEAVFLPHRSYAVKNREILASRCLEGYTEVVRQSSSPLYIRSDLSADFKSCALEIGAWQ
jgi:hypothetical protein